MLSTVIRKIVSVVTHDLVFVIKNGLLEPEDKNILSEEKRQELIDMRSTLW